MSGAVSTVNGAPLISFEVTKDMFEHPNFYPDLLRNNEDFYCPIKIVSFKLPRLKDIGGIVVEKPPSRVLGSRACKHYAIEKSLKTWIETKTNPPGALKKPRIARCPSCKMVYNHNDITELTREEVLKMRKEPDPPPEPDPPQLAQQPGDNKYPPVIVQTYPINLNNPSRERLLRVVKIAARITAEVALFFIAIKLIQRQAEYFNLS